MKLLLALLLTTTLLASLTDKSAIVYYGQEISYPMVGIHDYIIVEPENINTSLHGFDVYRDKIYAYVSIGEMSRSAKQYKSIKKEWILSQNKKWNSQVLDLKNPEYRNFLFTKMIEVRIKQGFKNFFFDTLDSYQLVSTNQSTLKANKEALISFIKQFHIRYPQAKLIVNRGFEIIDEIHEDIQAVLFESYYTGIGGEKLSYKKVKKRDRIWLNIQIKKIKSYNLDVICLDYLAPKNMKNAKQIIDKIKAKGMIPYIANRELDTYGLSSKNAIKREIFTLIDEEIHDRMDLFSHRQGGLILEYMGYVQKLHDIHKGLVDVKKMHRYAGVIIWLDHYYEEPKKLIKWIKALQSIGLKVVFANNFGVPFISDSLKLLNISIIKKVQYKRKILHQDKMMGFEVEPSLSLSKREVHSKNIKPLLSFEFNNGSFSTPAALTSWGGYAVNNAFILPINEENHWVVNPFLFFKETLRLKNLIVPDVTTQNGKRLLFTHVDGDGIANRVEGDFGYYSGDVILNHILKKYKIPHSLSVIGADISSHGLFSKISPQLIKIAKQIYALPNVESATHTFSHPFYWKKIKNNTLEEKYRLKPKGYIFSLKNELSDTLDFIQNNLHAKKDSKLVFWSGDCAPRKDALDYINTHHILGINGGDTTITRTSPWLSRISPLGIERDGYIQVFTGAQNENVFTNNWMGPYWGLKRVIQTFELTNSPRRFKPIDIYYHFYSGSKQASLKALTYVFDWAMKQDTMPIFTSEYIPKVMDYYTVSMANDGDKWLVNGMRDLHTIRIEQKGMFVDFSDSLSTMGVQHFENHTYLSLDNNEVHRFTLIKNLRSDKLSYLVSSNAKVQKYTRDDKTQTFSFKSYVDLKLEFHIPKNCKLHALPKPKKYGIREKTTFLQYKGIKKAVVTIICQ